MPELRPWSVVRRESVIAAIFLHGGGEECFINQLAQFIAGCSADYRAPELVSPELSGTYMPTLTLQSFGQPQWRPITLISLPSVLFQAKSHCHSIFMLFCAR